MVAFHAQQCIEKCLKAIIEEHKLPFSKIHSLRRLLKICSNHISLNSNDADIIDILDDLYIDARYPGDIGLLPNGKPTQTDAQQFHNFAKEIHHKTSNLI
jgi:HEPN domain-containing protein